MGRDLKFIVIDDDLAIRKTLGDVLEAKGFSVVTVGTGKEAIERVKAEHFNVAIIDIRLPDIRGTEVLKQIKQIKPQINCIVITAYPEEDPAETLKHGAADFLVKPIDLDRMLGLIQKMTN